MQNANRRITLAIRLELLLCALLCAVVLVRAGYAQPGTVYPHYPSPMHGPPYGPTYGYGPPRLPYPISYLRTGMSQVPSNTNFAWPDQNVPRGYTFSGYPTPGFVQPPPVGFFPPQSGWPSGA